MSETIDPISRLTRGFELLSEGHYAEGWPLLEARVDAFGRAIGGLGFLWPEWKGEPLRGKRIVVWTEQGFGDQIMFARLARMMRDQGAAWVTLACWEPLAPVFHGLADAIISLNPRDLVSVPPHDFWTRYFSAPGHLGLTLENLPRASYITAPAEKLTLWPPRGGVGFMAQSKATNLDLAHLKTMPADLAQELLTLGWTSLHPDDTGAADFGDTAAIIDGLELVVSVDTAVAHLAGAMGKPCFTMLPVNMVDWRWLRARPDSPWYPTMRLFRQTSEGGWRSMVEDVKTAVAEFLSA